MAKPKRKLTKAQKAEKKRRQQEYMTIFIRGKQKRVKRPSPIDEMDVEEFIRANADPIWLHQEGLWEYMEENAMPIMNPRVKTVAAKDDYTLELTFTNGQVGVFDCSHLLTFGVFKEFEDIRYFKRAWVQHGTVVWPNEQDICPDTLYEDSVKSNPAGADQTAPADAGGPRKGGRSA